MKIAIIGAMEQEVTLLRDTLENCQTEKRGGCEFYTGSIDGTEVVLLRSGIGKVAASIGTALLLEIFQPDLVINTGSAGGFLPQMNVGDLVISSEVRHHDVDVTAFGYEIGQMAQMPPAFIADSKLISATEQACANSHLNSHLGLIVSGDSFIADANRVAKIRENFPAAIACEMEAAGIAQTCHQFKVPFVVVRSLSDVADKAAAESFDEFLEQAAKHSSHMVLELIKQLKQVN